MSSITKRQHLIPDFLLRAFADKSELIWTYDKTADLPRCSSTTNTAVETHLYSVTLEDGSRQTDIESWIANVESKAAPVLEKFKNGSAIQGQERADLSSFIALMYVRTNAFRRMYAQVAVAGMQIKMHMTARHEGAFAHQIKKYQDETGPLTNEQIKDLRDSMLNPSKFEVTFSKEHTLRALGTHDSIAPIIFDMEWVLVRAPTNSSFILSDNPVSYLIPTPYENKSAFFSGGFADKHAEVTLPISPQHCWLGHKKKGGLKIADIGREAVKEANRLRAIDAERYLFGPYRDSGIQALAKKYKDHRPNMKVGTPFELSNVSLHRR